MIEVTAAQAEVTAARAEVTAAAQAKVTTALAEVTPAALAAQPFLRGMPGDQLGLLAETAREVRFPAGHRLFEDGGHAGRFWLIQCGYVALDLHVPGEGPVVIDHVGLGGLLGWSWRFPPYRWAFGAVAISPLRTFEFSAPAVRERCAANPALGYELTERINRVLALRLRATRVRLLRPGERGQVVSGRPS